MAVLVSVVSLRNVSSPCSVERKLISDSVDSILADSVDSMLSLEVTSVPVVSVNSDAHGTVQ